MSDSSQFSPSDLAPAFAQPLLLSVKLIHEEAEELR